MNRTQFENYFTGNCSADESREVEQWINDNIETDEFASLSREMLENMPLDDPAEARKVYRHLKRRIASTYGFSAVTQWNKIFRRVAGVAVIALVVFGAAMLFYKHIWERSVPDPVYPDFVQKYCRRGTNMKVLLPDSTMVTLFGDSRLVYDRNSFDASRRVWLFGDAFFDVTHREGSAFDVKCINTDIRVLGTSFEVLSHDADDNFEVSLYEGAVRLTPSYNGRSDTLRLHPGDMVRIDKLSGTITHHTMPWIEKDTANVVYIGSKVTDILSRLERRYDKSIILHDESKIVSETRLNLIYHPTDSLETILSAICEFSNLEMFRHGDDIQLKQKQ